MDSLSIVTVYSESTLLSLKFYFENSLLHKTIAHFLGIAIDKDGLIYFADGTSIRVINNNGGFLSTFEHFYLTYYIA